jgi:hypothetical protein
MHFVLIIFIWIFFSFGTNYLNFHYFLWENSLWYTRALDYEHVSGTNYAREPRHHCTSISWESVYKHLRSCVDVLIFYVRLFGVAYVTWWDFAIDPTTEQHQIWYKSREKVGPMLLWRFTETAWRCAKTSLPTLATKELVVASRQRNVTRFLFHQGIFELNNMTVILTQPIFLCFLDWR